MHILNAVARHQAAYSLGEPVNDALLPCLHFRPIKRHIFSMDANGGEFFLARLLKSFSRGQQGFERYAPLMEAGSTWGPSVNQGYMPSKLGSADRGHVTSLTVATYKYVNSRRNTSDYHRDACFCETISSINCWGFSTSSLKRARKAPAIAPSMTRWSNESASGITGRAIIAPCRTTALSCSRPPARIATSG